MNSPRSPDGTAPTVVRRGDEAREMIRAIQRRGAVVGLVPTMGALHAGHLSLVERSKAACDFTAVTIFVNPTQFGPHEDFARYPRTWDADLEALGRAGVDLVFAPEVAEMYPPEATTAVQPPRVAELWEGRCRPGHFAGVATIVLKLFLVLPADVAYFGQKDYQQTLVVRQMVADLKVPIRIDVCPTVRDPDGLAMSSRNRYLSPDERRQALTIAASLRQVGEWLTAGERRGPVLRDAMAARLRAAGIARIDYATVADARSLDELEEIRSPAVALMACHVGGTRLIDNLLWEE